ncbi:MAG: tetratricopeptide repeat protein, partial [Planctomycetota bacterium JB042]
GLRWLEEAVARERTGRTLCSLGDGYILLGRLKEAETCLLEATSHDDAPATTWTDLGQVLLRRGRADEAIEALERAAELRPHDPKVLSNLGGGLGTVGRIDEAERWFVRALELEPASDSAHAGRVAVLYRQGAWGELIDELERRVAAVPDDGTAWLRLADLRIDDELDVRRRDPIGAVHAALRARTLLGAEPSVEFVLARTLRARGDLEEARDTAAGALESLPEDDPWRARIEALLSELLP